MYKFLILVTYHPDTIYLREQGCEDPWLLLEAKRVPRAKNLGNTAIYLSMYWCLNTVAEHKLCLNLYLPKRCLKFGT
jgi:hypothetical protein